VARYVPGTATAGDQYYLGRVRSVGMGFVAEILKKTSNGVLTVLSSAAVTSGVGSLRFQVVGNNLKLFYGPTGGPLTLATYAYDTLLTTGVAGMRSSSNVTVDNFFTDVVTVPATQFLPFSENFLANPPLNQLSANWLERSGNFNVSTGKAVGQATGNLATLNGLTAFDIDLQAVLTLSSFGQSFGLVSRYTGPGEKGMYLAQITYTAPTTYTVAILKNTAGGYVQIGSAIVSSFLGTFRFQTAGTSMKIFLDNNLTAALTVTDASITGTGSVGMRASAGVQVSSFSAS